jgi:hypothetical protein
MLSFGLKPEIDPLRSYHATLFYSIPRFDGNERQQPLLDEAESAPADSPPIHAEDSYTMQEEYTENWGTRTHDGGFGIFIAKIERSIALQARLPINTFPEDNDMGISPIPGITKTQRVFHS